MNERAIESDDHQSSGTRYYYSCCPVPLGGWLCGLCLLCLGAGLFLQGLFPAATEAVWGGVLIVLGAAVLARART